MQLFLVNEESEKRKIFIPNAAMPILGNGGTVGKAVQDGNVFTLGVAETANLQLGQLFASFSQITASCHAIEKTNFVPPSPAPDWYGELCDDLETAKCFATEWSEMDADKMCPRLCEVISRYTATFTETMGLVRSFVTEWKAVGAINKDDIGRVDELLAMLIEMVKNIYEVSSCYVHKEQDAVKGILVNWMSGMNEVANALNSCTSDIQCSEAALANKIVNLNDDIKSMNDQMAEYEKYVLTGAGLVGAGNLISALGASICLCFPSIGGILIAGGAVSVVGGSVIWGDCQNKINALHNRIEQYNQEISDDNLAIVALNGLNVGVSGVIRNIDLAINNLSDYMAGWLTYEQTLTELQNTIHNISLDSSNDFLCLLDSDIESAMSYWKNAGEYADELSKAPTRIDEIGTTQVA